MESTDISVRWIEEFNETECKAIIELVNSTVQDHGTLGYAQTLTTEQATAFCDDLRYRTQQNDIHVLLGTSGHLPAVMAILAPGSMPNTRHRAELCKGVVHPAFRGLGLPKLAFGALIERAEFLGVEQFVLDVREGTRAHALWQRFGFTDFGVLDDYARVDGTPYRGHFMQQSVADMRARLSGQNAAAHNVAQPFLDKVEFKQKLRDMLNKHLTLSHPIFAELLNEDRPDLDLLRKIALQGYQLTRYFLQYIENLFFHCPLPKFKRALLINAYEEETGRLSGTDNHVVLMQNFIRALGVTDAQRDAVVALPATRELIDYRLAAVHDPARYHIGAAAVMIASEGQNLETTAGEARHQLLGKAYGLTEADLQFFSVHQEEDVGHVEQGLNLVVALCTSARMQQEALEAVDHTCRLFYGMYENMYREYCQRETAEV